MWGLNRRVPRVVAREGRRINADWIQMSLEMQWNTRNDESVAVGRMMAEDGEETLTRHSYLNKLPKLWSRLTASLFNF